MRQRGFEIKEVKGEEVEGKLGHDRVTYVNDSKTMHYLDCCSH